MLETIAFYFLAILTLGCAVRVVTTPYVFHAALYLVGSLLGIAGYFLMLDAEFLSAVQILVYVGGIVVLIIFAVMLTGEPGGRQAESSWTRTLPAFLVSGGIFAALVYLYSQTEFVRQYPVENNSGGYAQAIGEKLLSLGADGFILPFEVVSVLLVAAMVGAIIVAKKEGGK